MPSRAQRLFTGSRKPWLPVHVAPGRAPGAACPGAGRDSRQEQTMHGKQWALAVAVVGLWGCGGDEARVYDVEFDAAALASVPTRCAERDTVRQGPAENLAARQRWTLR